MNFINNDDAGRQMKLTDELLNEMVKENIGSDAVSLVQYLKNKEDVSEFKLAEILTININQVRNILYRLGANNLVNSIRKKDKKKGWYIYYWTFNMQRAAELIMGNKQKRLENMRHMLDRISNETFFMCPVDGLTLSLESAMEHQFKCPEDGELLKQKDNSLEIERLKREIEKLQIDVSSGIEIEEKKVRKTKKKPAEKIKIKEKKVVKEKKGKVAKLRAKILKKKAKMKKKK